MGVCVARLCDGENASYSVPSNGSGGQFWGATAQDTRTVQRRGWAGYFVRYWAQSYPCHMARTTTESRAYDHVFDSVYATSGAKDFYRTVESNKYSNVVRRRKWGGDMGMPLGGLRRSLRLLHHLRCSSGAVIPALTPMSQYHGVVVCVCR